MTDCWPHGPLEAGAEDCPQVDAGSDLTGCWPGAGAEGCPQVAAGAGADSAGCPHVAAGLEESAGCPHVAPGAEAAGCPQVAPGAGAGAAGCPQVAPEAGVDEGCPQVAADEALLLEGWPHVAPEPLVEVTELVLELRIEVACALRLSLAIRSSRFLASISLTVVFRRGATAGSSGCAAGAAKLEKCSLVAVAA